MCPYEMQRGRYGSEGHETLRANVLFRMVMLFGLFGLFALLPFNIEIKTSSVPLSL